MQKLFTPFVFAVLLNIACDSPEQLNRVEREVGDLKIEVFKLRRQIEDSNGVSRNEMVINRTQDKRFQSDLQSSLDEISEAVKVINARLAAPSRILSSSKSDDQSSEQNAALSSDKPSPSNLKGDETSFNAAVLDYNRGNYIVASTALKNFIEAYPTSSKKPEALFFLGLCSYNTKAFDTAQIVFDQIIREAPSSSQFLPAKLKRAQCLLRQNLKPAAIKAFRELAEGFSGTQEASIARQELDDLGVS